jgi:alkanesulfonate monooxygenase
VSVEFIGFVGNHNSSETIPRSGPVVDRGYIETVAKAHEHVGFDRVLLAFHASSPDSLQVGQHVASVTDHLGVFIAQRPGFTEPTVLARQFATLDALYPGRFAINIITGGDHRELVADGNRIASKDERYARTGEFLDIFQNELSSDTPFDYDGKYYAVKGAHSQVRPAGRAIDVFIAGASDAAIEVAGRHGSYFALWGETHEQTRELLGKVRAAVAKNGRPQPRYSVSFRPIIADTEEAAWAKADALLERARALQDKTGYVRDAAGPQNEGSRRLLAAAAKGHRHDKRLWTALAELTGARGNSTALVGTPDQVADALLDYYDLGIHTFLIRGFDPLPDAIAYGREIIPRVKALVAARQRPDKVAAA